MDPTERETQALLRLGTTLKGKWKLLRLVGTGGSACVYEAEHRNGKRVAIKMLDPELSSESITRERFLREGYLGNSVNHPGAVVADDDDMGSDGCAFLVLEFLDGESLESRRLRKGTLESSEVLSLMDQVLDVLAAAHQVGIVHRDINPDNLFLTTERQIKLLDFGIAANAKAISSGQTQQGSLMGTPAFMSPEQARGRWNQVDARSDIWSVGASIFTLLAGRHVHDAETVNETVALAITRHAQPLASVVPGIERSVAELVDKAIQYDPAERYQSAEEMQEALRLTYERLQDNTERAGEKRIPISEVPLSAPASSLREPLLADTVTTGRGVAASVNRGPGGVKGPMAALAVGVVAVVLWASYLLREPAPVVGAAAVPSASVLSATPSAVSERTETPPEPNQQPAKAAPVTTPLADLPVVQQPEELMKLKSAPKRRYVAPPPKKKKRSGELAPVPF